MNFADLLMARGDYRERPLLPVTLGMEIVGKVAAAEGGSGLWMGDRMVAFADRAAGGADGGAGPLHGRLHVSQILPHDRAEEEWS